MSVVSPSPLMGEGWDGGGNGVRIQKRPLPTQSCQTTIGTRYVTIVKTAAAVSTIRRIHFDHLKIIILSLNE